MTGDATFILTVGGIVAGISAIGLVAVWLDERNKRARAPEFADALTWVRVHVANMRAAGIDDPITRAADAVGSEELARRIARHKSDAVDRADVEKTSSRQSTA